jgi:hypothetical protein
VRISTRMMRPRCSMGGSFFSFMFWFLSSP